MMKVSHPHARVIHEQRFVVTNRTRLPKRKMVNKMYRTSTTWKYPPRIYDNAINTRVPRDNTPDKRVFFMIVATPMFGGVEDPGQDMFGADFEEELPDEEERVQHRPMRSGSVVSDAFGPAVMKPDPVDEVDDAVMSEAEPAVAGPSRVTRSAARASTEQTNDNEGGGGDAGPPPINLEEENDEVRDHLRALVLYRQMSRIEAEERKRNMPPKPPKPPKTPKPPKPPKPPVLETNEYGWAYNNTILIRPTFEVFWYNLNRRPGLRL